MTSQTENDANVQRPAAAGEASNLRAAVEKYLRDNDPEGFGCACEPQRDCGPCRARAQQRPLYAALAAQEAPLPPLPEPTYDLYRI